MILQKAPLHINIEEAANSSIVCLGWTHTQFSGVGFCSSIEKYNVS
jgi:hypothetical protein